MKNAWLPALAVGILVGAGIMYFGFYRPADRRAAELRAVAERTSRELAEALVGYQQSVEQNGKRVAELEESLRRERGALERAELRASRAEKRTAELTAILRNLASSSGNLNSILECIRSEVASGIADLDILGRILESHR